MKSFDFWFSLGSTYTYLSVMRLKSALGAADIEVVWRPFSVRALMQEMNNLPFVGKPAKAVLSLTSKLADTVPAIP